MRAVLHAIWFSLLAAVLLATPAAPVAAIGDGGVARSAIRATANGIDGGQSQQAEQPEIVEGWEDWSTGEWITFYAKVKSDRSLKGALVFFQARHDTHTGIGTAKIGLLETGLYELSYTHKIEDYFIRPFSAIDYHWEFTTSDDEKSNSEAYQFNYIDKRFVWNSLEESPFRVHWYHEVGASTDDETTLASKVIDAAQDGFGKAQDYLPIAIPIDIIEIYIYYDLQTLQSILGPNGADWVAGHADPDLEVIVAAVPRGPRPLLIQQLIPHELMHILLYQYTHPGFEDIPTWLNEGLATLVELVPNSDYDILLKTAVEKKSLLPVTGLCQAFPRDASGALLAYAEATSLTRYIHSEYGITGMDALVKSYANGLDCDRGARRALGRSLSQLERNWRSDVLAENLTATAANNLLPWALLSLAVFITPVVIAIQGVRKHRARAA